MWTDTTVTIDHGLAVLHVTKTGADVVGAPAYLFTPSGGYLGKSETTDENGVAQFLLPDQQYKFRIDYEGSQYWSDVVTIIAYEENDIELNLDLLALDLTNDPNPVRFDGVPPRLESEKAVVALLSSLPSFLAVNAYAQTGPEKTYFFINDHIGTPQKVIDETGVVVWSADYRPFGEANVTVDTLDNNFRFPGQYYDQETGLHYNWHRYYEPVIGRYLTSDPSHSINANKLAIPLLIPSLMETPQELHDYSYVSSNVVNRTDPSGLLGLFGPGLTNIRKGPNGCDKRDPYRDCLSRAKKARDLCNRLLWAAQAKCTSICALACIGSTAGYPACFATCAFACHRGFSIGRAGCWATYVGMMEACRRSYGE